MCFVFETVAVCQLEFLVTYHIVFGNYFFNLQAFNVDVAVYYQR